MNVRPNTPSCMCVCVSMKNTVRTPERKINATNTSEIVLTNHLSATLSAEIGTYSARAARRRREKSLSYLSRLSLRSRRHGNEIPALCPVFITFLSYLEILSPPSPVAAVSLTLVKVSFPDQFSHAPLFSLPMLFFSYFSLSLSLSLLLLYRYSSFTYIRLSSPGAGMALKFFNNDQVILYIHIVHMSFRVCVYMYN